MFSSFFKESGAKFSVPKSRNGRRSMRVSTLLKKDQAGSLLKHKLGEVQGGSLAVAVLQHLAPSIKTASSVNTIVQGLQDGQPLGNLTPLQSSHVTKSKPGDTPSTEPVTRFPTITTGGFSPPQSKLAELGRMIMSPSEVYPTRGVGQPHRSRVRHDENVVISSPDPDPITPVQTYGAGERA